MMSAPVPGTLLAGKYRVERVLGQGGMGVVLEAHDLSLDRRVAVKLLTSAQLTSSDVQRFLREGRAAARLESAHVARIYEVGSLPETGTPFLVMEHLVGSDLDKALATDGPMRPGDAVRFVLQACDAIGEAHALGIVHRDLKPANLFLTRRRDGSRLVKVLDFGISKLDGPDNHALTHTTAAMGSPYYMSPEQVRDSKRVGPAADLWSIGVILFELVSGSHPFDADTLPALSVKIAVEPAPLLRTRRPDAPPELEAVVQRCLEKDPARRFGSIAELVAALTPLQSESASLLSRPISLPGLADASGQYPTAPGLVRASNPGVTGRALSGDTFQPASQTLGASSPVRRAGVAGALFGGAVLVGGIVTFLATRAVTSAPPAPAPAVSSVPSEPVRPAVEATASAAPGASAPAASASAKGSATRAPTRKGTRDVGKAIRTLD